MICTLPKAQILLDEKDFTVKAAAAVTKVFPKAIAK
jgi:hypothetical protein